MTFFFFSLRMLHRHFYNTLLKCHTYTKLADPGVQFDWFPTLSHNKTSHSRSMMFLTIHCCGYLLQKIELKSLTMFLHTFKTLLNLPL